MEIEGEKTKQGNGVLITNDLIIERLTTYISNKLSGNKPKNMSHFTVEVNTTWTRSIVCATVTFYHFIPEYITEEGLQFLPPNSYRIKALEGENRYNVPRPICRLSVDINNNYETFEFYRRGRPNHRFSDSVYYKWLKFYQEFLFGEYAPVNNKSYYTKQPRESWK